GRGYHVEITKPIGIRQKIDVPAARSEGCSLMALDDFDSKLDELRVATWCSKDQTVLYEAVLREHRLASAAVDIKAHEPTIVALPASASEQGAVRLTLLSEAQVPLAERLVYRGRHADTKVEITADRSRYSPRDPVTLTIKTKDLAGKPVAASLGLSVVDDTVLSFADDKAGNLISKLYLESELGPDQEIEEPNFYFGDDPKAAASLDLLMGTKGWRSFEWQYVFNPQQYGYGVATTASAYAEDALLEAVPAAVAAPAPARARRPTARRAAAPAGAGDMAKRKLAAEQQPPKEQRQRDVGRNANLEREEQVAQRKPMAPRPNVIAGDKLLDANWDGEGEADNRRGGRWGWAPVRVFPAPTYSAGYDGPRTDFRETIFWAQDVRTDESGTAKVTFYVSDAVTSFRATAEGISAGGLPGRGEAVVQSKLPVNLDVHMPLEVSAGDQIILPVTLTNETDRTITAKLTVDFGSAFKLGANPADKPIALQAGEKKAFFMPLDVIGKSGEGAVQIAMQAEGLKDEVHKQIRVVPLGFPFQVSLSGTAKGTVKHEVDLTGALDGTTSAKVLMYPSPVASMTAGAAALIREPGGCFEQTSAINYPNIMVMRYLQENDATDANLVADAGGKLQRGYMLLTGYETKQKGYEWFGESPGHEALTAYGLMEFKDMADVMDGVDKQMVERTADWLMSRRDGKGSYQRNAKALDSFGRASVETTSAYVTWALSEAGRAQALDKELAFSKKIGLESKDPYMVALATNTWLNVAPGDADSKRMTDRLAEKQDKNGSFPGAAQSITMSGGESLAIETTSLATLALIKASQNGEYEGQVRLAVDWLDKHRGGYGEWGSTQGTVLALKALTAYAAHTRQTQASGTATVYVNGKQVGEIQFEKGRREPLDFSGIAPALRAGKNTIEIKLASEATMPYSVAIEYRAARPQSSPKATIGIETSLAKKTVKMGEGIKLHARISNETDKGQPMTIARIGLPGGLTFQTWQLKELKDKGTIGFYETRQREVIVYLRDMKPSATVDVDFDLMATVPGQYVGPATSAYLYYTDEHKSWVAPVRVTVEK
ncbi:MAG TPA: alpha-2-macroglobulin family protein, partial [Polyangiales bacterium]|nr:alpha-2-macroglobulin family protein [Polyangiales bacterium]